MQLSGTSRALAAAILCYGAHDRWCLNSQLLFFLMVHPACGGSPLLWLAALSLRSPPLVPAAATPEARLLPAGLGDVYKHVAHGASTYAAWALL